MFAASNIHYEIAERTRGIGIGTVHHLARRLGLIDDIDRRLHLLKIHLPYHASDHVLNIAYNALCVGTCLHDVELRRNDEVFLDALGAERIPDPTTAEGSLSAFRIRSLYAVETDANEKKRACAEVAAYHEHASLTMKKLADWLAEKVPKALPKGKIGEALGYAAAKRIRLFAVGGV